MSAMGLNQLISTVSSLLAGSDASSADQQQGNPDGVGLALEGVVFDFNTALSQAQQTVQQNIAPPAGGTTQGNNAPQPGVQPGQGNAGQSSQNTQSANAAPSNDDQQDAQGTQNTAPQQSASAQDGQGQDNTDTSQAESGSTSGTQDAQDGSAQDSGGKKSSKLDELNALLAEAILMLQGLASAQTSVQPVADTSSAPASDASTAAIGSSTNGSGQDPLSQLMSMLAQLLQDAESGAQVMGNASADTQSAGSGDAFAQLVQLLQSGNAEPLSASDMQQLAALLNGSASGTGAVAVTAGTADVAPLVQNTSAVTNAAGNAAQSPQPTLLDALKQVFAQLMHAQPASTGTQPANTGNAGSGTQGQAQNTSATVVLAAVDTSGANTSGQNGSNTGGSAGHDFLSLASIAPLQASGASGAAQNTQAFSQVMNEIQNVEQASPAEQVVAYVKAVAAGGDSRIQIQLHPADLGSLDIKLSVTSDGHANLSLTADNPKTLELLRSDAKQLTQMLTDIGLKADAGSLSFNLRGDQQGGQGQQSGQGYVNYGAPSPDALDEALAQAPVQSYAVTSADGINIVT